MPLKVSFKLPKSIRCLFRNVKRFQKLICFLVDTLSELVHNAISLGCRHWNSMLLIRLPGHGLSNGLSDRQSEIFAQFPPKGSFNIFKIIKCLLRNVKRLQTLIWFFSRQILWACAYYNIARLSVCYAPNKTAGHGLKWTKCPAVINFHQNATERFFKLPKSVRCLLRNVKQC